MFRTHAPEFVRILAGRPACIDPSWLGRIFPRAERRVSILDLGCGAGRLLRPLANIGSSVVGLDYSAELLACAMSEAQALGNVTLVKGDMRNLGDFFPKQHFQVIVRAYTSLGYFSRTVEGQILRACHDVSTPDGRLIVDTFNAEWFRAHPVIERTTHLADFDLLEHYAWNEGLHSVRCLWRYTRGDTVITEIPFDLDGYTLTELDQLLSTAGWARELLIRNIDRFQTAHENEGLERLVVVARKAKK
ncbi:MAG: class I SAM-dependent methyltransferase [Burkholderiales bacterium]|nr:class I SAM-dependent methyltransferase [Burkholderiales bacterium]